MAENIIELNNDDFDSFVAKGNSVVDFWATWCGPCKIMAPHFEAAAKEFKGKVHFAKVNIEESYELADKFHIMSVPTTVFFKNGEIVEMAVGALSKEKIIELVKNSF